MKLARAWMVIAGPVLVILASLLVLFADKLTSLLYSVYPPTPRYQTPRTLSEAQRDDLDYLRKITWLDWSYTGRTRSIATAVIDEALRKKVPLSPAAFELVVSRVLASADNGHTNVWGQHDRESVQPAAYSGVQLLGWDFRRPRAA